MKHKLKATITFEYESDNYNDHYDRFSVAGFEQEKAVCKTNEWIIDSGLIEEGFLIKIEPVKE